MVSVIIPVFNEEKVIGDCLHSLSEQTFKEIEVITVDDGSTDNTLEVLKNYPIKILKQNHLGAGMARNLGASMAQGKILVFVDSDMVFDKDFIKNLIEPIIKGEAIGTFSKEEYVYNKENIWSKCWNFNKGLPFDRMHPNNYPDTQPVFRSILKSEFDKVHGFESIGYIDDYTLSDKLGRLAVAAPNAVFYHLNPGSLSEIFTQARWIGKSEFKKRKIRVEALMKLISIIRYSLPVSLVKGIAGVFGSGIPRYLFFKIIYDLGIEISLVGSIFGEQKYR